jgi:hypothetical protein
MDGSIFSDPKCFQGIWFSMHVYAMGLDKNQKMRTDTKIEIFDFYINNLCDNFKCGQCKTHFRMYIDKNKFGDNLFKWTWEFHNKVNKFLKKNIPTHEDAYSYFSGELNGMCMEDCGEHKNVNVLHNYFKLLYFENNKHL